MTPQLQPRLPFAPLRAILGDVWSPVNGGDNWQGAGHSAKDAREEGDVQCWRIIRGNPNTVLAELLGVHRRTLVRWTNQGVPEREADRIACSLGFHVCEIWPEWFDERP